MTSIYNFQVPNILNFQTISKSSISKTTKGEAPNYKLQITNKLQGPKAQNHPAATLIFKLQVRLEIK